MSGMIRYSTISGQDNWRLYKLKRVTVDQRHQLSGRTWHSWDWARWKKTHRSWAVELKGMVSKKLIRAYGAEAGGIHMFKHAGKTYYAVMGFKGWDYQFTNPKYRVPSGSKRIAINDVYVLNKKGKTELVKRGFITDFTETIKIMAEA